VAELEGLRAAREKEARDGKARESELCRNLTNLVAETDGALDRLGRQVRQLGEEGEAVRGAHASLSNRVAQVEDVNGEAARKLEEVERAVQAVNSQAREQREIAQEVQASSQAGVKELHGGVKELQAAISRIEREISEVRGLQAGGNTDGEIVVAGLAAGLPASPSVTKLGSVVGTPAADRRVPLRPALVRRFSDLSAALPMSPTRRG
jgi:chromosome segregation ATPase